MPCFVLMIYAFSGASVEGESDVVFMLVSSVRRAFNSSFLERGLERKQFAPL